MYNETEGLVNSTVRENMTDKTLIVILLIWLGSNIILPLLIRSLDRLYKENIDNMVSRVFSGATHTFNRIVQIIFIVFFLPVLGITKLLSKFNNKKIKYFLMKTELDILSDVMFDKDFTTVNFIRSLVISRERENPKNV